ncbi:MAG: HD domain-containing protein [Clostridia bacterium]|nr:HD domain-containing protein [Clostridia bacterium]
MNVTLETKDLVECIADAIDLISPDIQHHHRRVICIAHELGEKMGLPANQMENLTIAAAMHDIGASTRKAQESVFRFEDNDEGHARSGSDLLGVFRPFTHVAPIVRHHHTHWPQARGLATRGETVPVESQILHLADRLSVLIKPDFSLTRVPALTTRIMEKSGAWFQPDVAAAFQSISKRESFWLDARDGVASRILTRTLVRNLSLADEELRSLGRMFRMLIDFRSSYTAAHSAGVAAIACALADRMGFSEDECVMMQLAGELHDIGKLAVPESVLDKNGILLPEEYAAVRSHTYYTDRLLSSIPAFDSVRVWSALHHERLNGFGYPFKYNSAQIPMGSRIMAVADVFTAVTEDRPYREGIKPDEAAEVITNMVGSGGLDPKAVHTMVMNFDEINAIRLEAQQQARTEYAAFTRPSA